MIIGEIKRGKGRYKTNRGGHFRKEVVGQINRGKERPSTRKRKKIRNRFEEILRSVLFERRKKSNRLNSSEMDKIRLSLRDKVLKKKKKKKSEKER